MSRQNKSSSRQKGMPLCWRKPLYFGIGLVSLVAAFGAAASTQQLSPRETYTLGQICAHCHARKGTAAPMMGDSEAWRQRTSQGFEVLVKNTILGVGNMPPLGTCGFCTEQEIRNLVAVMSGVAPEPTASEPTP